MREVDVVVEEQPVVLVLDDDPGVRTALAELLTAYLTGAQQ